jgi:hypothetical protein
MISLFETITDVTGYKFLRKSFGLRSIRGRGRTVCVCNEDLDGLGRSPILLRRWNTENVLYLALVGTRQKKKQMNA